MTVTAQSIRLDWSGPRAPHAVLDLLRGCNLSCPGCYNVPAAFSPKPLPVIQEELARLLRLRRLQTISFTGGEPLLHPELEAIVRLAKAVGLRTVLMTNAVLLDAACASRLRAAGVDMVLMHIQSGQNRPDLPDGSGVEEAAALRREKARLVTAAGMDAGFSALMYANEASRSEIAGLLAEIVASETAHFAMICPQGDFSVFTGLAGDLAAGFRQPRPERVGLSSAKSVQEESERLYELLRAAGFGLFAWIGASTDAEAVRWSAWNSGVVRGASGTRAVPLTPAWTDRVLLRLVGAVCQRQLFHLRASAARFRVQLLLALLDAAVAGRALRLLANSCRPGTRLLRKHVVVELPPAQQPDGSVVFCRECPDATLRHGRLVPPCLADRVAPWAPPRGAVPATEQPFPL